MIKTERHTNWIALLAQTTLYFVIWWILSDGELDSLWIGIPTVLLATAAGKALQHSQQIVWYELFSFIPFFLSRSLFGAIDVAWRVFHPSMPINPVFYYYSSRLPKGLAQVFLANTISLLPGTLSVTIEKDVIQIHVLDKTNDFLQEIEKVEERLARLFGITFQPTNNGH